MPDLSFVREKLKRAHAHIEAADAIAKAHCESDFYGVQIKHYRHGWHHLRITGVTPFPADFSILVGEAAYQLRSSLDHLAFAFCSPRTGKEERAVQFPFARRASEWRGESKNRLPGASRRAKALFERFQPYHSRKEPRIKLLRYLNAINNWEKHRAPATVAAGVRASKGQITFPEDCEVVGFKYFYRRVMKAGAVIARFQLVKAPPHVDVNVKSETRFTPIFDKRMSDVAMVDVLQTLEGARIFISNTVLPKFESLS